MNLDTFYNLLAFKAILLYNSLLNHCLLSLDKVWIKLKNHNLDTVFRHRMWSLYVKSDEVDQQIVERNCIYLFFFFPPLLSMNMLELQYLMKLSGVL